LDGRQIGLCVWIIIISDRQRFFGGKWFNNRLEDHGTCTVHVSVCHFRSSATAQDLHGTVMLSHQVKSFIRKSEYSPHLFLKKLNFFYKVSKIKIIQASVYYLDIYPCNFWRQNTAIHGLQTQKEKIAIYISFNGRIQSLSIMHTFCHFLVASIQS
jgi:hypothetical protein